MLDHSGYKNQITGEAVADGQLEMTADGGYAVNGQPVIFDEQPPRENFASIGHYRPCFSDTWVATLRSSFTSDGNLEEAPTDKSAADIPAKLAPRRIRNLGDSRFLLPGWQKPGKPNDRLCLAGSFCRVVTYGCASFWRAGCNSAPCQLPDSAPK
jgi:hypothetical protein